MLLVIDAMLLSKFPLVIRAENISWEYVLEGGKIRQIPNKIYFPHLLILEMVSIYKVEVI